MKIEERDGCSLLQPEQDEHGKWRTQAVAPDGQRFAVSYEDTERDAREVGRAAFARFVQSHGASVCAKNQAAREAARAAAEEKARPTSKVVAPPVAASGAVPAKHPVGSAADFRERCWARVQRTGCSFAEAVDVVGDARPRGWAAYQAEITKSSAPEPTTTEQHEETAMEIPDEVVRPYAQARGISLELARARLKHDAPTRGALADQALRVGQATLLVAEGKHKTLAAALSATAAARREEDTAKSDVLAEQAAHVERAKALVASGQAKSLVAALSATAPKR